MLTWLVVGGNCWMNLNKRGMMVRGLDFIKPGMCIMVDGDMGTVKGANKSANLDVVFDGDNQPMNCHPTWETVYYGDNGEVIADFTEPK